MVAGDDNDVFTGTLLDFMDLVAGEPATWSRPEGRP